MSLVVLNRDLVNVCFLDAFESFIWTDRFAPAGEFELYTPVRDDILQFMQMGNYIFSTDSYDKDTDTGELMIIENVEIETDIENGSKIKYTGRNLKGYFDRRIIWNTIKINSGSTVYDAIKSIIVANITNPVDVKRKLSMFEWVDVTGVNWPTITEDIQLVGETVYDAINSLCEQYGVGYRVYCDFATGKFKIEMIVPVDRTYEQRSVPPVLFSASLGNLSKSNYLESSVTEKNVGLVAAEDSNGIRTTAVVGEATLTGFDRKELYIDGSGVNKEEAGSQYTSMLTQVGNNELSRNKYTQLFEGETENGRMYTYGTDYYIGDIVELVNEFGFEGVAQLTEMVTAYNDQGYTMTPTFTMV